MEELDRRSRQLNLIVYILPENKKDPLADVWERIDNEHRREIQMSVDELPQRLGRRSSDNTKARPVRIKFDTLSGKHLFLKYAKTLRQAGFRVDDDLTRLQQKERESYGADFQTLKSKGYIPFFRGSQLQYFHANKMHHCKPGMIDSIPRASMVPAQPETWQGIDISTPEAAVQALLSEGKKKMASLRALLRSC